jgi:hypothetical protein
MMLTRASLQLGLLLAAIAGSALPLSSVGQVRSPFDGRWRVEARAQTSKCSARHTVAIQVANGQIRGTFFGFIARGGVDRNGKVILRIDGVRATGALAAKTGRGRWRSRSCNGTWTARRS